MAVFLFGTSVAALVAYLELLLANTGHLWQAVFFMVPGLLIAMQTTLWVERERVAKRSTTDEK